MYYSRFPISSLNFLDASFVSCCWLQHADCPRAQPSLQRTRKSSLMWLLWGFYTDLRLRWILISFGCQAWFMWLLWNDRPPHWIADKLALWLIARWTHRQTGSILYPPSLMREGIIFGAPVIHDLKTCFSMSYLTCNSIAPRRFVPESPKYLIWRRSWKGTHHTLIMYITTTKESTNTLWGNFTLSWIYHHWTWKDKLT